MTDNLDRAIHTIDAYLAHPSQHTDEPAYPTERGDTIDGRCWRCRHHPAAGDTDLCAGCRAWLLEDTNHDPAATASTHVRLPTRSEVFEWFGYADEADFRRESVALSEDPSALLERMTGVVVTTAQFGAAVTNLLRPWSIEATSVVETYEPSEVMVALAERLASLDGLVAVQEFEFTVEDAQ